MYVGSGYISWSAISGRTDCIANGAALVVMRAGVKPSNGAALMVMRAGLKPDGMPYTRKRQAKSISPSTYVGIEAIVVNVFCRFMSWAITTNANMKGV